MITQELLSRMNSSTIAQLEENSFRAQEAAYQSQLTANEARENAALLLAAEMFKDEGHFDEAVIALATGDTNFNYWVRVMLFNADNRHPDGLMARFNARQMVEDKVLEIARALVS